MTLRILVVDDEPLARIGITARLSAYSDMLGLASAVPGRRRS